MTVNPQTDGVVAGRLASERIEENFADIAPRLSAHEAAVAADRCYFCYDAPCVTACPTAIDIPMFIRQIAGGQPETAARTIFEQNILGGMCARVCPTETLCEEACVRELAEEAPVEIGRLQRYATDALMKTGAHPFERTASTGKRIAVVGAGPAGLACAHRLAMLGHDVVIHDAAAKPGGLNEFGIAAYKTVEGFAQAEVAWLLEIGGIEIVYGSAFGEDVRLDGLLSEFDAVFLGVGLGGVGALFDDEAARPAVDFISELRQAEDLSGLPVGRRVVVIGGGMTAVDAAVQSKHLGAEDVAIVYRREQAQMSASAHEQEHAATSGVRIICNAAPVEIRSDGSSAEAVFAYTENTPDGLKHKGEQFTLPADQVLIAIGQKLEGAPDGVELEGGKIRVDAGGQTSRDRVWAGGDCALGGEDLTVTAVAQGRDAAMDINRALAGR